MKAIKFHRLAWVLFALAGVAPLAGCATSESQATMSGYPFVRPETRGNLLLTLQSQEDLETFNRAVRTAGLQYMLAGKASYTVLAPTNVAFNKLPPGTLEDLLRPQNRARLAALVRNHIMDGSLDAAQLSSRTVDLSLDRRLLQISAPDGQLTINGAVVEVPDLRAANGVVHIIDTVLMP